MRGRLSGTLRFLPILLAAPAMVWNCAAWAAPQPATVPGLTVNAPQGPIAAGPGVSPTGANDYTTTAQDIVNLPTGDTTPITDVLTQMPGVAIDQNQQIHIRNTEGPQFQYQINGVLVPIDINTNPPFISMINPMFVERLDLLDGVLPARYSYATGGVVDIQTKDGCEQPGGSFSLLAGQRQTLQPSLQYGGCAGKFSYYMSALYDQGDTAFSSATPGPNPIHDFTQQGQAFGFFTYQLNSSTRLSVMLSAAVSDNQLPNQAGLDPQFVLDGVAPFPSADINSYLNFRDYLGMVTLKGSVGSNLTYQLAYTAHYILEDFKPDNAGELIYQGVASTATHQDLDHTLEGDLTYQVGRHAFAAGFYAGAYRVTVDDSSLVFPLAFDGQRSFEAASPPVIVQPIPPISPIPEPGVPLTAPITVVSNVRATNVVLGLYVSDLWQVTDRLAADFGARLDSLSGFTNHQQFDPTINLTYKLSAAATVHGGFARYMQVPSFQGLTPNATTAFHFTTAQETPGGPTPLTEDDYEWDVGLVYHLGARVTLSQDDYYERTIHYLDTGQFGVVPIFAPFNYAHGYIWGSEFAARYRDDRLTAYANLTIGQNWQKGVVTGQFNFDAPELAFIDARGFPLDHQPLIGVSAGAAYHLGPWAFTLNGVYSTGLRGGFADQEQLPDVVQVNGSVERTFHVPGLGRVIDRLIVVNMFDRTNLIRPAEGIGIFQAAYGPRFTLLDSLTIPF
ncbi:MAG: TonB-dependent receptor [Caulobacteraceae bacterium]